MAGELEPGQRPARAATAPVSRARMSGRARAPPAAFLNLDGADYSLGEWRHGLNRACRRAGLREVGWHTLRHTYASHPAMRRVAIKAIQELMGHATIAMTMRYVRGPERRRAVGPACGGEGASGHPAARRHGRKVARAAGWR